ncbi:hypothetical protein [Nocardioides sp. GXQ0305]|jgi:hypothetical protein|uniref:hypothetical protein n=1 Tax=Nocardioides sp. GXQ0305 TaxID=3423912 RepID=UPI003D7CCB16
MVYVALVLFTLAVVALGAWAVRRQACPDDTLLPCSTERLGIRDIRDVPFGPPSSL